MMVPILDEVIAESAEAGIRNILIGMAHRGRLNVMAHVLNKPYAQILAEFKDPVSSKRLPRGHGLDRRRQVPRRRAPRDQGRARRWISSSRCRPIPATSKRSIRSSRAWRARRAPSVDGPGAPTVRSGAQRADPDSRRRRVPRPGRRRRNAEPEPAARLQHRRHDSHHRQQPARIHDRVRGRLQHARTRAVWRAASRSRSSTSTPTIPEACVEAARLAIAYRAKFQRDFLIDLIGYRRYGHNEGDEAVVHPAADVPEDRLAPDGARDLGAHAGRARRDHRGAGRRGQQEAPRRAAGGARRAAAGTGLRRAAARGAAAGRRVARRDRRAARAAARR